MIEQIDANGTSQASWEVDNAELALNATAAFTMMDHKALRLDAQGRKTKLGSLDARDDQLLVSYSGQLVGCRSRAGRQDAGCHALGAWEFTGDWQHSKPLLCGEWLLEPVEATYKLRVRTMATGEIVSEQASASKELACDGLLGVVDLSNQRPIGLGTSTNSATRALPQRQ